MEKRKRYSRKFQRMAVERNLNLASRMKLTGINQLWVADITYVRLRDDFVYLWP